MIVVSLILGMGIFRTPASVARDAGSPGIFFAAWIFGAIIGRRQLHVLPSHWFSPALPKPFSGVDRCRYVVWKVGAVVSPIVIVVSIAGYAQAGMMSNPRMYVAMAQDRVLGPAFLKENQNTGVKPAVLNLFTFFILLSLVFAGTFEKLLEYIILFDNIGLASAAASIFILRKRQTGEETGRVFNVRPYPLVPVLFLTSLGLVTLGIVFRNWRSVVYATAFFLLGWPIYVILKRWNSRE